MAAIAPYPKFQAFDSNGDPLASGKLYTYLAGGTTPATTYTTPAAGTPNANPVVLDARGEANVWLDPTILYKFVLKTSADVTIWTVDNIGSSGAITATTLTVTGNTTLGNAQGDSVSIVGDTVSQTGSVNQIISATSDGAGFLADAVNGAGGQASFNTLVAASPSTNDAYSLYEVDGVTSWSVGVDNSDSDSFKIGVGLPGFSEAVRIADSTLATTLNGNLTFNGTTLAIPNNLNIDANTLFIDAANNRVVVGTSASTYLSASATIPKFQVNGLSVGASSAGLGYWADGATSAALIGFKSRSGTIGTFGGTALSAGDDLLSIQAWGDNGAAFAQGGEILFEIDAATGTTDMPTRLTIKLSPDGSATPVSYFQIKNGGSVILNATGSALATNATTGFTYIPTCAGTPTGVPVAVTGCAALIVDSTNHKLYFNDGSWRDAGP